MAGLRIDPEDTALCPVGITALGVGCSGGAIGAEPTGWTMPPVSLAGVPVAKAAVGAGRAGVDGDDA